MKTENLTAKILKIGAIVMFALCFIGSLLIANIEITEYSNLYDDYEYNDDDEPKTITEFDESIFVKSLITSAIGCTLIFAFGELIEITYQNNKNLKNLQQALNEKIALDMKESLKEEK